MAKENEAEALLDTPIPKKSMLAAMMENGSQELASRTTLATEFDKQSSSKELFKEESKKENGEIEGIPNPNVDPDAVTEPSTQISFHPKAAAEVEEDMDEIQVVAAAPDEDDAKIIEDIDLAVKKQSQSEAVTEVKED